MSKIYFLGFYTEGDDVDGCYDLSKTTNQIKEKLSDYFEEIFLYSKRDLKDMNGSENFCNEYEEELDQNKHANRIGFFDFKPFLIAKKLSELPEGSILLYHDTNFEKCPQYWHSDWQNIRQIAEKVLNENMFDVWAKIENNGAYIKNFVKQYTLNEIFTQEEVNVVNKCKLINAAQIFIRNSKDSRKFIDEWKDLCLRKDLIMKTPNDNQHPDFQWNCGDQDVLNCLFYRYILDRKINYFFPRYSFFYRVIRVENKPFDFPNQNWNPHPTGIELIYNNTLIDYLKNKNL